MTHPFHLTPVLSCFPFVKRPACWSPISLSVTSIPSVTLLHVCVSSCLAVPPKDAASTATTTTSSSSSSSSGPAPAESAAAQSEGNYTSVVQHPPTVAAAATSSTLPNSWSSASSVRMSDCLSVPDAETRLSLVLHWSDFSSSCLVYFLLIHVLLPPSVLFGCVCLSQVLRPPPFSCWSVSIILADRLSRCSIGGRGFSWLG